MFDTGEFVHDSFEHGQTVYGLVRMNPAGLSGLARFPRILPRKFTLAEGKRKKRIGKKTKEEKWLSRKKLSATKTVWPRERKSDNYYYYPRNRREKTEEGKEREGEVRILPM